MSYCRFSSDDYGCDVYVYEADYGGWTIHVAENKVVGDIPKVPAFNALESDQFLEAHNKQMEFLKTADREKIGLPFDGESFNLPTPLECAEKLIELKELGYRVPQYAIESLMEE